MKSVIILGSTGSIGRSALNVISRHRDKFKVAGLTAHGNAGLLLRQIEEFRPEVVAVSSPEAAKEIKKKFPVLEGQEGLCEVAAYEGADFVLSAIVGSAGLLPTLFAIRAGKTIGLANKETLVTAGTIVLEEARKSGSKIIPVDSEHSALFQCMNGRTRGSVRKLILTASGGPFAGRTLKELEAVTPDDALRHPSWEMGKKITIDSATLMNKGLEVIEAHHLFGMGPERIEVVVHPQSIIHSMVEFIDGSIMAQMSVPDMRAAIAYALSYPERLEDVIPPLNLCDVGKLTFRKPDFDNFPCLSYAYDALKEGGTMPAVLNAANEVAVTAFLDRRIGFNSIPAIIKKTMETYNKEEAISVEAVIRADEWARRKAEELITTPPSLRAGS